MAVKILETGRSFPNPISGAAYDKPFKRPASGKYRSHSKYPDPGTGTDYIITFDGNGPGSRPLGTDIVHYLGRERTSNCGNTCDKVRTPIYRFFRGAKNDHSYSNEPELQKEDTGAENERWEDVIKGYNKEPRKGVPVFYVMDRSVSGSSPLKKFYSYWPDNTQLTAGGNPTGNNSTVGSGRNKYKYIKTLGYIFTSSGAAAAYQETDDPIMPLYHFRRRTGNEDSGSEVDDLYTIDPYNEINITGGPIASRHDGDGTWVYQGILGYVFTKPSPQSPVEEIIDGSEIGPTGHCVDKSDWYAYDDNNTGSGRYSGNSTSFSYRNYRMFNPTSYGDVNGPDPATPGLAGWGNGTDGVEITNNEAHFEWFYGLSGATKASVPRYLGFEDSYDTQFIYYLYDTSLPWNGPIFSCQYVLNDIPCCPNGEDEEGEPTCTPGLSFHSHFYEIKDSAWETTATQLKINDGQEDANACFYEIDTRAKRILFRYTTNNGNSFSRGQKLNGWDIQTVYYFGDELKCGMIELVGDGNDFTSNQSITSETGAGAIVLAGRGIANRAAFCGVYEFPKKISFYKVEIDPRSLIPHRTLDEAVIRAKINKKGKVKSLKIINSGSGYKNPIIKVINPRVLEDFSATDTTKHTKKHQIKQNPDWEKAIPEPGPRGTFMRHVENNYGMFDVVHKGNKAKSKDKELQIYKEATVEITKLSAQGGIEAVRLIDGGDGYNPSDEPNVFVADPEYFEFTSPPIDNANNVFGKVTDGIGKKDLNFADMGSAMAQGFTGTGIESLQDTDEGSNQNFVDSSFGFISDGLNVDIPDSYIRIAEESKEERTKHCFNLPSACINIDAKGNIEAAMPGDEQFEEIVKYSEGASVFNKDVMPQVYGAVQQVDQFNSNISHVYGAFGRENCITTGQPKLYNISRWFDMPCPYLDASGIGEDLPNVKPKARKGEKLLKNNDKAFGWLPFKYCASDQQEASFRVSLEVKGKTIGTNGDEFMRFLKKHPKPELARARKVPDPSGSGDNRVWDCNDGSVNGRCFRDPGNSNNIIFIPVGGDENTYDYNTTSGLTEVDQLKLWMGDNITNASGSSPSSGSGYWQWQTTIPGQGNVGDEDYVPPSSQTNTSPSISYYYVSVDCPSNGNYPKHECWDSYVGANGPLQVYCGYDSNGNGIQGSRWWEITSTPTYVVDNGDGTTSTTTGTPVTNPWCSSCAPSSIGGYTFFGFGGPPARALTFVNDCSIAIQPQRIDSGSLNMRMGPYDGKMTVRNWLTGSTIALSRALDNTGNPFFDECSEELIVGRPYQVGRVVNEGI